MDYSTITNRIYYEFAFLNHPYYWHAPKIELKNKLLFNVF